MEGGVPESVGFHVELLTQMDVDLVSGGDHYVSLLDDGHLDKDLLDPVEINHSPLNSLQGNILTGDDVHQLGIYMVFDVGVLISKAIQI